MAAEPPRRNPLNWSQRYQRQRWEADERKSAAFWEELKKEDDAGSTPNRSESSEFRRDSRDDIEQWFASRRCSRRIISEIKDA